MSNKTIKNNIRRLRFENNEMTQQELADKTGCTRQTIILLEQERYTPSLALAFKIAEALNSAITEVFKYVK